MTGPFILEAPDTTIVVPPGACATLSTCGIIVTLEVAV